MDLVCSSGSPISARRARRSVGNRRCHSKRGSKGRSPIFPGSSSDQLTGSKRIALFLPNLGGGGAERVVLAQARELVRRGHKVDLVLIHSGGALLDLLPS